MSLDLSTFKYGNSGAFASQTQIVPEDIFYDVLGFLGPKDLGCAERVCKSWKAFIEATGQWEKQCQGLSNIIDAKIYEENLGVKIGDAPPLPAKVILSQAYKKDPEDPLKTIAETHTWFYNPSEFELKDDGHFPYVLNETDESAQLIPGQSEKGRVLTIANTLNNIEKLFCHSKKGAPSKYSFVWENITSQHGNEQAKARWICMRNEVIEKGVSFAEQQVRAQRKGFIIPSLLERVHFNFLKHMITGKYPDGEDPWTYARTSTPVKDDSGTDWPTACGNGGPSGLDVGYHIVSCSVGLAVALPAID